MHYVKRFLCEITSDKRVRFISEAKGSVLSAFSTAFDPEVTVVFNKQLKETKNLPDKIIQLGDFIEVKGMKAQGNQLTKYKVKEVLLNHAISEGKTPWPEERESEIKNDIASESVEELENDKIDNESDKQNNEKENLSEKTVKSKTPEEIKSEKTKSKKVSKPKKDKGPTTVEWDLTNKNSKDDQMKLF